MRAFSDAPCAWPTRFLRPCRASCRARRSWPAEKELMVTLPPDLRDLASERLNNRLRQLARLIGREPKVEVRQPVTSRRSFLPSRMPLIQAPMASSQGTALAIAVCKAGGLGLAAVRDDHGAAIARAGRAGPRGDGCAIQRQFLLPSAAGGRRCCRGGLADVARRAITPKWASIPRRSSRARAAIPFDAELLRGRRGGEAGRRVVPFRAARQRRSWSA